MTDVTQPWSMNPECRGYAKPAKSLCQSQDELINDALYLDKQVVQGNRKDLPLLVRFAPGKSNVKRYNLLWSFS